MSPKYSSLAFDELKEGAFAAIDEEFMPALSLIQGKQSKVDCEGSVAHRAIAIRGTLQVSF